MDNCASADSNRSIKLVLPGNLEFLRVVDKVTETLADYLGFGENERNAIAISVIEACTNAIQHGCGCNEAKNIAITYEIREDLLKVTVLDTGSGFDPCSVRCDLDEVLGEPRGRGIAIIRSLMDEVTFGFEGGTSLTMVKRRSSASEKTGT